MKIMKKETETKKEKKTLSYIHTSHHRTWSSIDKKNSPSLYDLIMFKRREEGGKDFWVFGWVEKKLFSPRFV
jgi:hypothetical protein